jgi:hypothetical protein
VSRPTISGAPRRAWGAGRVLLPTVGLPFGLLLFPLCRYQEQRPDRDSRLQYGLSRVPPQLALSLKTWRVAGNRDCLSGRVVGCCYAAQSAFCALEIQVSPERLRSRPCAFGHGYSSVWASSASAVPIPGKATRLGVGASLWAFSRSTATCLVTHDLSVLILSGVLAASKWARLPTGETEVSVDSRRI